MTGTAGMPAVAAGVESRSSRHLGPPLAAFVRQSTWFASGDLGGKVAIFVAWIIAARVLGLDGFGTFATLQAIAILGAVLLDVGLWPLVTREVASGALDARGAMSVVWSTRRVTALPWLVGVGVVSILAFGSRTDLPQLAVIVVATSLVFATQTAMAAVMRGQQRFRRLAIVTTAARLAALPALVITALLGFATPGTLALAWAIGDVLLVVALARLLGRPGISRPLPASRLRDAAPFGVWSLVQLGYNRLDLILVTYLSTAAVTGAYAVASRVQDALIVVPTAVAAIAFPHVARANSGRDGSQPAGQSLAMLLGLSFVASSAVALAAALTAPYVLPALGPQFAAAVPATQIITLSIPIIGLTAPLAAGLAASGSAWVVTAAILMAFATVVVFDILTVPTYGAPAAALAAVVRELPVLVVLGVAATPVFRPRPAAALGTGG